MLAWYMLSSCVCPSVTSRCSTEMAKHGITQTTLHDSRDDHGNGILNGNGNPMGIPWEWELVTNLGMGMGRNGKQPVWEWEWLLFPWESIPIAYAVLGLCNNAVCCIFVIVI